LNGNNDKAEHNAGKVQENGHSILGSDYDEEVEG